MEETSIFSNEFIEITLEKDLYYLKVHKSGMSIGEFNQLLMTLPRVKVTQFVVLKAALDRADSSKNLFGERKPLIDIQITKDKLEASAIINMTEAVMRNYDKKELMAEILQAMSLKNIVYGFDIQEIVRNLKPLDKIVIAKGLLPQKGEDAIIRYYTIEEAKPEIDEKGDVNHYELNLINRVDKGEWLGERIEPKDGIPGKTVTGDIIPALKGNQEAFKYDRKTVYEEPDIKNGLTYIKAGKIGAVVIENDIIGVCNYLEIDGNVSFKTGNVDFDGYLDVKETVEDNFSVSANHDIQILGKMGVGSIDQIESREGSIYIKGGIAGKGKAKVICDGDLYTKFAADCNIECKGTVHIGFYALNANIKAKEVVFDAMNSKVIGGSIDAEVRVKVGTMGNRMETPTKISVSGFRRDKVKEEYDFINETIGKVKDKMNVLKQKMSLLEMVAASDPEKKLELNKTKEEYDYFRKNLKMLYEKQKKCISYLRAKGEGEVVIGKCVYPKVSITLGNDVMWISEMSKLPVTYYTDGTEILTV